MTKKINHSKVHAQAKRFSLLGEKNPLWKIPGIRLQFLVTILISGMLAIGGFTLTWHIMPYAWKVVRHIPGIDLDRDALQEELSKRAKNYDLPADGKNRQEQAEFESFFDCLDSYTGIAIYAGDGHYCCAQHTADIVRSKNWNFFTQMIFQITYSNYSSALPLNGIEDYFHIEISFKNETGELYVSSFHNSKLTIPWFLCSIGVALFFLLLLPLLFLRKKVQDIGILKDHILQMSGGDLKQPVSPMGNDELGVLALELDQMRQTLYANIQQEAESHRANQDLITAMSHDLRTPLTILHGYLDILALGRNPELQSEYIRRCLQKTEDIQQLTDRMFEYSLVYEPPQTPVFTSIPLRYLYLTLAEHLDFLRLAGFQTSETIASLSGQINGDETSLKRLFQNLFSNILKYGDKSGIVTLQFSLEQDSFRITISNAIKPDHSGIESNRIGLKSAEKIAAIHHGALTFCQTKESQFIVNVKFPLVKTSTT